MRKIKVVFSGGQSKDGVHGCNFMISDDFDLYAEVLIPEEMPESDAEFYRYEDLRAEILKQAADAGIDAEQLDFTE